MRNIVTTSLIAVALLGVTACSGGENSTVANSGTAGEAGNAAAGQDGLGTDVTAVDNDAAFGNDRDAAALPSDNAGAGNLTDNAAAPAGNSF